MEMLSSWFYGIPPGVYIMFGLVLVLSLTVLVSNHEWIKDEWRRDIEHRAEAVALIDQRIDPIRDQLLEINERIGALEDLERRDK